MRFYEYDAQGFLVGSHEDANRPNSTLVDPSAIPPSRARWDNATSTWLEDTTRETQLATDDANERTKLQQAIDTCKAYNPSTATAAEVRATLGAALILLRRVFQELR